MLDHDIDINNLN